MSSDIKEYGVQALIRPDEDHRSVASRVAHAVHKMYTSAIRKHPGARMVATPVRLEEVPQLEGLVFSTGVLVFGEGVDDGVDE